MHKFFAGHAALLTLAGLLALVACGGGDTSSQPVTATPSEVSFGEVDVAGDAAQTVTLTNTSAAPLTITDVTPTGKWAITSGRALPVTLAPGEQTSLFVELAPVTSGDVAGAISVSSSAQTGSTTLVRFNGRGVKYANQLDAAPGALVFPDVPVGAIAQQVVTVTNSSSRPAQVTSISVLGRDVTASGLTLPATIAAGESATLTVAFAPSIAGAVAGSVSINGTQPRPLAVVEFSGNGLSPAVSLGTTPTALDFRDVTIGSYSAQSVTLTNPSSAPVTVSEVATTGTGFTASSGSLPTTLAPGAAATVTVRFTPTASGPSSGRLVVKSATQADPLAAVDFAGTGVPAASITSVTVRDTAVAAGQTVQLVADVVVVGTIDRSVRWAVESGSLGTVDAQTGVYTAPATGGTYRVSATSVADPTRKATGSVTVSAPVVAPTPAPSGPTTPADPSLRTVAQWESLFLQSWDSENVNTYLPLSTSGNSWKYYNLAYGIDGLTAMFEATGNTKYLDRALLYIHNVIASAVPSSSLPNSQFKDGYLGWGAWDHPYDTSLVGGEYPLTESYCFRYVTKLLRVMRNNPAVYADPGYRKTYDDVLAFTKKNIFEKWATRGSENLYRSRTHMASHWAFIAADLWVLSSDPAERATYRTVVDNVNLHLPNYSSSLRQQMKPAAGDPGAYFWSDVWGSSAAPGQDVSHGNNVIAYIVEAHDLGIEWTDADVHALSKTLLDHIWISTSTGYQYGQYVDGSGAGNGWFNDGFCKLGRYDVAVQKRLESHPVGQGMQLYGNAALNAKILNGR